MADAEEPPETAGLEDREELLSLKMMLVAGTPPECDAATIRMAELLDACDTLDAVQAFGNGGIDGAALTQKARRASTPVSGGLTRAVAPQLVAAGRGELAVRLRDAVGLAAFRVRWAAFVPRPEWSPALDATQPLTARCAAVRSLRDTAATAPPYTLAVLSELASLKAALGVAATPAPAPGAPDATLTQHAEMVASAVALVARMLANPRPGCGAAPLAAFSALAARGPDILLSVVATGRPDARLHALLALSSLMQASEMARRGALRPRHACPDLRTAFATSPPALSALASILTAVVSPPAPDAGIYAGIAPGFADHYASLAALPGGGRLSPQPQAGGANASGGAPLTSSVSDEVCCWHSVQRDALARGGHSASAEAAALLAVTASASGAAADAVMSAIGRSSWADAARKLIDSPAVASVGAALHLVNILAMQLEGVPGRATVLGPVLPHTGWHIPPREIPRVIADLKSMVGIARRSLAKAWPKTEATAAARLRSAVDTWPSAVGPMGHSHGHGGHHGHSHGGVPCTSHHEDAGNGGQMNASPGDSSAMTHHGHSHGGVQCEKHHGEAPAAAPAPVPVITSHEAARPVCAACGSPSPELKRCARCLTVTYCSDACQRAAWKTHKQTCRAPAP